MKRRTLLGAAWSTPVILAATAAPSAAASTVPPVDTNPCTNGTLSFVTLDPWQKGQHHELWQGVQLYNHTPAALSVRGRVEHASAHLAGVSGADTFTPEPANSGTWQATIPAHGSVVLRVQVENDTDNSACWLTVDACALSVHMKTVGKIDRVGGDDA